MADTPNCKTVPVKSAWESKINWTQAIGTAASLLTLATSGKFNIPPEQQATIVVVIQGVQALVTWVLKTWFTPTVSAASVTK